MVYGALHRTDSSRLYYGTDTRAVALLVGAALAAMSPLPQTVPRPSVRATRIWTVFGLARGGSYWAGHLAHAA